MSEDRFLGELRDELLRVAESDDLRAATTKPRRSSSRATRTVALGAVAALLVVLVAGGLLWRSTPAVSADVEIAADGDDLVVELKSTQAAPDEIEAAAAAAGLDLTVTVEPVQPTDVGHFLDLGEELPVALEPIGAEDGRFRSFRIPRSWSGELTVVLGRLAAPDEQPVVVFDGQDHLTTLECPELLGMTVADASRTLADRDVEARWVSYSPAFEEHAEDELDRIADWTVTGVIDGPTHDSIEVQVAEHGDGPLVFTAPHSGAPDC